MAAFKAGEIDFIADFSADHVGVTANLRVVDKVSWMNTATQDGPFDMYVEDLASLMTLDQNTFLSASTASWNSTRHTDPQGRRVSRPPRPGDGSGEAQGHCEGAPGVLGR